MDSLKDITVNIAKPLHGVHGETNKSKNKHNKRKRFTRAALRMKTAYRTHL